MSGNGILIQGEDPVTGEKVTVAVSSDSMHMGLRAETITANSSKDRLFTGDPATRQRFTWSPGEGPTTIFMKAIADKTVTAVALPAVKVTFDAETTVISDANLAQAGGVSVDMQNERIEDMDSWIRQDFDTPLESLDFITASGVLTEFRVKGV